MPVYEFKCHECKKYFEKVAKVADHASADTKRCPVCGKEMIQVFLTPPAVYAHGCPSYQFKREANEADLEKKTNKRLNDQNMAEIADSMKKWEIYEGDQAETICPSTLA